MRNRFDHLAKQIGQKMLGPFGATAAHDPIHAETQYADLRYEPGPAHQAERDRLGLLGRLAAEPCLIEVYSQAFDAEGFRACLTKHLVSWQGRARAARAARRSEPESQAAADPFLWIITAGVPRTVVTKLKLEPARDWPAGVYLFGDDVLRVGIIVASELPRDRATLLVRMMAAGPLLAPAVEELAALPPDAIERVTVEPILLDFQRMLGENPGQDADEQEFIMAMYKTWEEGKTEARAEGRAEARANAVLTVLRVRGIAVPDAVREQILAQQDLQRLEQWLEKAIVATSIGDVIDSPN
jgi:hypothetical protein